MLRTTKGRSPRLQAPPPEEIEGRTAAREDADVLVLREVQPNQETPIKTETAPTILCRADRYP